jgi:hypothetical protein
MCVVQEALLSEAPPALSHPTAGQQHTQMLAQLQTAAAERAGLAAQAESMATAHADLAQQVRDAKHLDYGRRATLRLGSMQLSQSWVSH